MTKPSKADSDRLRALMQRMSRKALLNSAARLVSDEKTTEELADIESLARILEWIEKQ